MGKHYSVAVRTVRPDRGSGWERAQHWFAIAGPIGLFPWVPATLASLVVATLCRLWPPTPAMVGLGAVALLLLGAPAATTAERLQGEEDPRNVVIDEVAGQWLTFVWVAPTTLALAAAGFVLFRFFDITKPFPIRRLERLPRGWGIMADDLLAGLYAAVVLGLARRWMG
jgi:phosphatidylglycerophosphatase A